MTVAEEINALSSRIQDAFDVCEAKGATMPAEKTTWTLSACVDSIPAGGGAGPVVTLPNEVSVYENYMRYGAKGTTDAIQNGTLSQADTSIISVDMSQVQSVDTNGLTLAFVGCPNISYVKLPTNLVSVVNLCFN